MNTSLAPNPYDAIADKYDRIFNDQNPYYGPINVREWRVFDAWVPEADRGQEALDIGCGTGFHTEWLIRKRYRTFGIDISAEMLRVAKDKSRNWLIKPELLECDALKLNESPLSGHQFDVIICLGSTLNHIGNWPLFSQRISDHLKQGGRFVFSYDNFLGIDSLLLLFKRNRSGYNEQDRRRNFISNMKCLFARTPFHNHWRMEVGNVLVEVPLTYDTTSRLRLHLSKSGLNVKGLSGVHLLSCFSKRVLEASAWLDRGDNSRTDRIFRRMLHKWENHLSSILHFACANTVAVAVKE